MNLDHELRRALTRKEPPGGFDRQVLARIASGDVVRNPDLRPSPRRFLLPVAASLVLTLAGTYYVHERERRAAERATIEVTAALRIASDKLATVQTKVREFNQHEH